MTLKPATYEGVMREGFGLQRDHHLPPNTKEALLRVVVYDVANDRVGSVEARLKGHK